MARTSVSLKVLAADVGRVQERLQRTGKVVPLKVASSSPPWKQSQANDDEIEKAPDSGVRGLENHALSYTVYSIAELEARPRTSAPPPLNAPPPSRWPDVLRSAKAVVHAWWSYYLRAKPRPQMMDVCRVPLMTLRADLVAALKQLPWRKIGMRAGIAFASTLALLFVVITVAELTDDLKPSRTATATSDTKKVDAAKAEAPVAAPPPAPAEAQSPAIEIDEAPPPVKKAAVKVKPPPPSVKKKKKGPDIFNP